MTLTSYALQGVALYLLTRLIMAVIKRTGRKDPFASLPDLDGGSFLFGHLTKIFADDGLIWHETITREHGGVIKIGSLLGDNTLWISDPKALYHIFVKDHETVWDESPNFLNVNAKVFGPGLVSTAGSQHRKQRKLVNPVFSAKHLRDIAPIVNEVSVKLADSISRLAGDGKVIEVFDWLSRGALEGIGKSGFGYSFDPLDEQGQGHPYAASVKLLHSRLLSSTNLEQITILPIVDRWNLGGRRLQRWIMANLTWGTYRQLSDVVNVMDQTASKIYESRKKDLEDGTAVGGSGKDILTSLMRANMSSSAEDRLTDQEILAQISTLVFAGMDTTSSSMARLLWVLSNHQAAQGRLRDEIRQAKESYGTLNYDEVMGLPYLDAVCRETLRMYPPVPLTGRHCAKDAVLPLHTPIRGRDGQVLTEVVVPASTDVMVSLLGCNRSVELWGPDASEWNPDRWLNDLPQTLVDAKVAGVYSHLMTFIGGGRSCVGFKFAQLEMKMMTFHLLDRLKFSPAGNKEILWRPAAIITPAVDFKDPHPQLPMIVERV
ncbi:cytochrome P450 [Coprinopsis sp. MPI-PUGE-AT-0042]|nr:cytochrome P450 [Coprinopsis sp. MPI-PUGE-AT-0042]